MHNIIKNDTVVTDDWIVVSDTNINTVADLPDGKLILPLQVWQTLANQLEGRDTGVWLNSDQSPAAIRDVCHTLPIIAINFPVFTDGRGYSYAHVLRGQYGYRGELRAIGDVLVDQLFFMKRCGFDSFAPRADLNPEIALKHLQDFSITYQAAIDKPAPLFRQR